MSTCTPTITFVLFKEPPSLKTRRRERGNTKEGLAPNEVPPRNPMHPRRRRKPCPPYTSSLILKPCNPTKNTLRISSWPKPKTTIHPRRFSGPSCTRDFLEWLDTLTLHDTRQVNVMAHNFQGYDGYFIIHQYYGDNRIVQQLRNGCKLLEVKHDRIRFIDSMSFFQMSTLRVSQNLWLEQNSAKGTSHTSSTCPMIVIKTTWASSHHSITTCLRPCHPKTDKPSKPGIKNNVPITWCLTFRKNWSPIAESDVRLLKQGCLTFKRLFEDLTGFNPFEHITIASACNRDLRMNRMIPNSIASEPTRGWRNKINQSTPALHWLTWCDHQLRQRALQDLTPDLDDHDLLANAYPDHPSHRQYVQHVRNAGEYNIPGTKIKVDGYCPDTRTVYEFQGCFTHGCPTCYPNRHEKHPRHYDRTMHDVYETTQDKVHQLTKQGYKVIQMWGCEWKHLKKTQPDIDSFVQGLDFIPPLQPRDAFCGGRTNAVKLYHGVTPGQKIHYIDVTSLYPWVNKTSHLPQRTSHLHFTTGSHRHPSVLWPHSMPSPTTPTSLPSCPTLPSRRQTHLSPLCYLCPRRNEETSFGPILPVPSHRRTTHPHQYLVQSRIKESRRIGVPGPIHLRSLAFPRDLWGPLRRLCEHLAAKSSRKPVGGLKTTWPKNRNERTLTTTYKHEGIQLQYD